MIVWLLSTTTLLAQPPQQIDLSPVVAKLLDDSVTTDAQRRSLALFHGQWERIKNPTAAERAQIAWWRYDLSNPVLANGPALLRAHAALARGEADVAIGLLEGETSVEAALVRAKAFEHLGSLPDAVIALTPWRDRLRLEQITDAPVLTSMTEAMVMLARLEGRPAAEYSLAMSLFGKVRSQLDPLYWPACVAEARLLIDKDNLPDAANALVEALRLNPMCSQAWYLLGQLSVAGYDFDTADRCGVQLRTINGQHLLADLLDAQSLLTQKQIQRARAVIELALGRYPTHRTLWSLLAATEALAFDQKALRHVLDRFETLSPKSPLAHYTVGKYLSAARQYDQAAAMLQVAIERGANWPQPRIELGLLLMQRGQETAALTQLRHAVQLDPFNRRAHNQLRLAQELVDYEQIRTEHFVIKFRPGIDGVLAQDMPEELERIYRHLTGVFGYHPPSATVIEILPDEKRFAVRITGMPDIWTVAACTGDVIAMTPPRSGADQSGTYDWLRVIQHEFVHTLTLNQTHYRIPHWFTEGCAVSQEPGDRPYHECVLLATSFATDGLFDLDEISWAFVRPKTPRDRPLAYAQAGWMIEYLTTRFGFQAVIKMLDHYGQGATDAQAIVSATGQNEQHFMRGFRTWANQQIQQWGLGADSGTTADIHKAISGAGGQDGAELNRLLAEHPNHPELLRAVAHRTIALGMPQEARLAILRYAAARPMDPWSDQQLVNLAMLTEKPNEAIASLQRLDRQDSKTGKWAHQLAQIHRAAGQLDLAASAIRRALNRQPYNPSFRELAATIDVQAGHFSLALNHLKAMATLEPDRSIHQERLAALYRKMDRGQEAAMAAKAAQALDAR